MRDDGRIELGRLNLGWNDTRTERLLARVKLRIGRRARVRRAVLASTALTSVACVAAFALRSVAVVERRLPGGERGTRPR